MTVERTEFDAQDQLWLLIIDSWATASTHQCFADVKGIYWWITALTGRCWDQMCGHLTLSLVTGPWSLQLRGRSTVTWTLCSVLLSDETFSSRLCLVIKARRFVLTCEQLKAAETRVFSAALLKSFHGRVRIFCSQGHSFIFTVIHFQLHSRFPLNINTNHFTLQFVVFSALLRASAMKLL